MPRVRQTSSSCVEEEINMWEDNDYCYECTGYGDDWYEDENGELQSRCGDCPFNPSYDPEEDW